MKLNKDNALLIALLEALKYVTEIKGVNNYLIPTDSKGATDKISNIKDNQNVN